MKISKIDFVLNTDYKEYLSGSTVTKTTYLSIFDSELSAKELLDDYISYFAQSPQTLKFNLKHDLFQENEIENDLNDIEGTNYNKYIVIAYDENDSVVFTGLIVLSDSFELADNERWYKYECEDFLHAFSKIAEGNIDFRELTGKIQPKYSYEHYPETEDYYLYVNGDYTDSDILKIGTNVYSEVIDGQGIERHYIGDITYDEDKNRTYICRTQDAWDYDAGENVVAKDTTISPVQFYFNGKWEKPAPYLYNIQNFLKWLTERTSVLLFGDTTTFTLTTVFNYETIANIQANKVDIYKNNSAKKYVIDQAGTSGLTDSYGYILNGSGNVDWYQNYDNAYGYIGPLFAEYWEGFYGLSTMLNDAVYMLDYFYSLTSITYRDNDLNFVDRQWFEQGYLIITKFDSFQYPNPIILQRSKKYVETTYSTYARPAKSSFLEELHETLSNYGTPTSSNWASNRNFGDDYYEIAQYTLSDSDMITLKFTGDLFFSTAAYKKENIAISDILKLINRVNDIGIQHNGGLLTWDNREIAIPSPYVDILISKRFDPVFGRTDIDNIDDSIYDILDISSDVQESYSEQINEHYNDLRGFVKHRFQADVYTPYKLGVTAVDGEVYNVIRTRGRQYKLISVKPHKADGWYSVVGYNTQEYEYATLGMLSLTGLYRPPYNKNPDADGAQQSITEVYV